MGGLLAIKKGGGRRTVLSPSGPKGKKSQGGGKSKESVIQLHRGSDPRPKLKRGAKKKGIEGEKKEGRKAYSPFFYEKRGGNEALFSS